MFLYFIAELKCSIEISWQHYCYELRPLFLIIISFYFNIIFICISSLYGFKSVKSGNTLYIFNSIWPDFL